MQDSRIKIGMGQLLVEGGEPERNLERALDMMEEAAEQGCKVVVLPETLDLAWTHPSAKDEAEPVPGPRSELLCEAAKRLNLYLCAGLTERDGDKVYNTAILADDQGQLLLKYRKINVLTVGQEFYAIGDQLRVVHTPLGCIGVDICSDNYHDSLEIGHVLARMGAQLILSPSSWTSDFYYIEGQDPYGDKWFGPYHHLASLFDLVVVGCTSVGYIVGGPYEGKKMVGCSLAVDKNGLIKQGDYNEFAGELVVADVEIPVRREKGTEIGEMLQHKGVHLMRAHEILKKKDHQG